MAKAKKKATKKDATPVEGVIPAEGAAPALKAAKGKRGKAAKAPKAAAKKAAPPAVDFEALRKPVDEARTALATAEAEAHEMTEKAHALVAGAKDVYRAAVAPYREACRKAGVPCEYEGGRGANVSEKVTFLVEKTEKGVRVAVKGRETETEELIPLAVLKESINKASYAFCEKHVGPREVVGNKGGSLSNRLRAVLR